MNQRLVGCAKNVEMREERARRDGKTQKVWKKMIADTSRADKQRRSSLRDVDTCVYILQMGLRHQITKRSQTLCVSNSEAACAGPQIHMWKLLIFFSAHFNCVLKGRERACGIV